MNVWFIIFENNFKQTLIGPVVYLAIVIIDFFYSLLFIFSRLLLFTHFGDTQEADFLWALIFLPN